MPGLRAQPPAIDQEGVRNAASRIPPSLPGGALAPGARFTIAGLRLAAAGAQTRVRIAQGTRSIEAQVISAGPERIEARVPMEARAGEAQLTVVRADQSSRAFALRIAPAALGIFAKNGSGWGPGRIVNEDGTPNSNAAPAPPGSTVTMLGTGWGRARSAEIYAGGRRARFLSRSQEPGDAGTDAIRFQLAADTPQGCYVSLVAKLDGPVSNVVTIAVAAGQPCHAEQHVSGMVLLTHVRMRVRLSAGHPVAFPQDIGAAIFSQERSGEPVCAWELLPPTGTCTGFTGRRTAGLMEPGAGDLPPLVARPGRDAGPGLTISGPDGTALLKPSPHAPDIYLALLGGGRPLHSRPPFLDPGRYTISAPGGSEVGAFTTAADFASNLDWVRPERLERIDRARGVRVEWTGATARQRVLVAAVNVDPLSGGTGACVCVAPGTDGQVQLPPLLLANLPASRNMPGIPQGYVLIATLPGSPPDFRARGVENGMLLLSAACARTAQFK
jgi:uncharacterized protein (TIGR03437 family)